MRLSRPVRTYSSIVQLPLEKGSWTDDAPVGRAMAKMLFLPRRNRPTRRLGVLGRGRTSGRRWTVGSGRIGGGASLATWPAEAAEAATRGYEGVREMYEVPPHWGPRSRAQQEDKR